MTSAPRTLFTAAALTLLLTGLPALAQQERPMAGQQGAMHQQMAQQQHLAQMEQTMQRLHQLEQQASQLARNLAQRAGRAGAAPFGPREQAMQQLCDSVAGLARDMTRTMDRIHQSLRDPALLQDRDQQQDMDRLRLHIEEMAAPLSEAVQTMDRIQSRLHQPGGGG